MNRPEDDGGSMLVEMLVGTLLMSIVAMLVLQGVVGGFRSQRQLQNRGQALAQLRMASERLARDIRNAEPVLSATATTLELRRYASNGDKVRMLWQIVGTSLRKSVYTTPVGSSTESAAVTSTVIDDLSPGVNPFGYAPVENYTPVSGSGVNAATCEIGSTGSYDRDCIGEVILNLSREVSGNNPVVVQAEVDLRNKA